MEKLSATAAKHLAAITAGTVTKTNIIGVRKALNHVWRLEAGYSGNRSNVTPLEASKLLSKISSYEPRVAGELHDSGLALLRSPRYAKRLAPVAEIIRDLSEFRLIGFEEIGNGNHVPIYRAATADGRRFAFRNVAWQSGGNGPEIIGVPVTISRERGQ